MKSIAQFYTLYWIIYFPTCIAFNDWSGFSYVDEVMTVILIGYTVAQYNNKSTNRFPWKEYKLFLGILTFYVLYSLIMSVNQPEAVQFELIQQIRPYSIIYCTWVLNPKFNDRQKKLMFGSMLFTLLLWLYNHPETIESKNAEFSVLGQLAICCGMAYYLFTDESKRNNWIALVLVLLGMLAPKMKFVGEVVVFVAMIFFIKKRLDFRSPRTIAIVSVLVILVIVFTWTKFDAYYVSGFSNEYMARPMTYKTSLKILRDYFPLGSGMGTFASYGAAEYYSPLYYKYDLDGIWGLTPENPMFLADAFYPTLAQYGIVGVILFGIFWKRRLIAINKISDLKYYKVAMMAFFCLAIEQTADTSFLSGKGMGYCMLIGLCLNANRNMGIEEKAVYQKPKRRGIPPTEI